MATTQFCGVLLYVPSSSPWGVGYQSPAWFTLLSPGSASSSTACERASAPRLSIATLTRGSRWRAALRAQRKLSVTHHELKAKTDGLWGKAGGEYHAADGRAARQHKQVEANFRGSEAARVLD